MIIILYNFLQKNKKKYFILLKQQIINIYKNTSQMNIYIYRMISVTFVKYPKINSNITDDQYQFLNKQNKNTCFVLLLFEKALRYHCEDRPPIERIYDMTIQSIFCFQFVRVRLKSERKVVEYSSTPRHVHFLIADARTIYCSQSNSSYGRNRIDALLEVGLNTIG